MAKWGAIISLVRLLIRAIKTTYKYETLLVLLYLLTRLINLTALPIFNDESIYLDWGWREFTEPHNLYFSLFDGKQPFLMWIFGFFEILIPDQLFAGRLVSVIAGFLSLIGIYLVSRKLADKKIAYVAMLLYIVIPIFTFYDRQALMESAISCVGIWAFYLFILNVTKPKLIYGISLGAVLGIGLFIKSTPLIFLLTIFLITFYVIYNSNNSKFKKKFLFVQIISFLVSQIILLPLYSQPRFQEIALLNSRYSYSITDVLGNFWPILFANSKDTIELLFFYFTPILFALLIIGTAVMIRNESRLSKFLVSWLMLNIISFILLTKSPSTRYIVALLPLSTIICSYAILKFARAKKKTLVFSSLGIYIALFTTAILILSPINYFYLLNNYTKFSDMGYINGWTSGYGIEDARKLILKESKGKTIKVEVRHDYGNPEDAMYVYFHKSKNIKISYIDFFCDGIYGKSYSGNIKTPIYFVSRGGQYGGNEKCLIEIKRFYKPDKQEFIGVYKVRTHTLLKRS